MPPVFLAGELVGSAAKLQLAEGHTRLGSLAGAMKFGLAPPESLHEIWLGTTERQG